jgi:hypothetical protein
MCRGWICGGTDPVSANPEMMTNLAATQYTAVFQQLRHRIFEFEPGGVFAGDARPVVVRRIISTSAAA